MYQGYKYVNEGVYEKGVEEKEKGNRMTRDNL
jgi:hypothetical protein